ncbi:hypothetical protein FEZ60_01630 [Rhodococcus sp. MS16]|nr:hypothetical protein [Rhodococcus sp. MS16]
MVADNRAPRAIGAQEFVPDSRSIFYAESGVSRLSWVSVFHAAQQTVLGQGRRSATVMLVGEQPGGQEDRAGKPFVGAAGKILHQALDSAQIEMDTVYITKPAHRQEELHLGDDIPVSCDPTVFATIHPSAILRGPPEQRRSVFDAFVRDCEVAVAP